MIPVTVIAGYLGAGKTTLINRLLASGIRRVGVLVNDFGPLAIDAALIRNRDGETLQLDRGCVCCRIGDDLGAALEGLRATDIESVLVEASGVALPARVAAYGRGWPGYREAGVFTVVDARSIETLLRDKYVARLVRDQIEQADLLLVSGTDVTGAVPASLESVGKPVCDLARERDVSWLLEPRAAAPAGSPSSGGASHCSFAATTWVSDEPLERSSLERLMRDQPAIRRAKGWFSDSQGQRWLLQAAAGRQEFEAVPGPGVTELVFIHEAGSVVALSALRSSV